MRYTIWIIAFPILFYAFIIFFICAQGWFCKDRLFTTFADFFSILRSTSLDPSKRDDLNPLQNPAFGFFFALQKPSPLLNLFKHSKKDLQRIFKTIPEARYLASALVSQPILF